jgi:hypothetical protein
MNPTKGKGERYIYCPHDSECIDHAAISGWRAFHCEKCEVYLRSSTYEEKQILEKKTEKKRREGMAGNSNQNNHLMDLHNMLFDQMKRLTDEDLDDEGLDKEIKRSKAASNLAAQIIQNAKVAIEGSKAVKSGEVDGNIFLLGSGK